jgi:hypothetical protein
MVGSGTANSSPAETDAHVRVVSAHRSACGGARSGERLADETLDKPKNRSHPIPCPLHEDRL